MTPVAHVAPTTYAWSIPVLSGQPVPELAVIAEADQLHQTPVVPVIRRVQQSLLPVQRVLPQRIHHLLHRVIERRPVSGNRQPRDGHRPAAALRNHLSPGVAVTVMAHR